MFDVNTKSAFFCLQAEVKLFRKQGGGGTLVFSTPVLPSMGLGGTSI
jgi:NAD(P)-dependent dehydrogenase (short-subunit alcohol dehydrogenase family)